MQQNLKLKNRMRMKNKYRKRSIFLFMVLILFIGYYVKTDIISLVYAEQQTDTIQMQTLTIDELNLQISNISERLYRKETEIQLLHSNLESLKKVLNEKKIKYNTINIVDSMSVNTGSEGEVIKIGQ